MSTTGHYGDIAATCRQGECLTRYLCLELKRGYAGKASATPHALLDRPNGCSQQVIEEWIQQAEEGRENCGAFGWLLIHRRDKREAVVITERKVEKALKSEGAFRFKPFARMMLETTVEVRQTDNRGKVIGRTFRPVRLVAFGLNDFLEIDPDVIRRLSKAHRDERRRG